MLCLGDESLGYNCSSLISQIIDGSPHQLQTSQHNVQPVHNSPNQMPNSQSRFQQLDNSPQQVLSSQQDLRQLQSPPHHINNSQQDFDNLTQVTPNHSPSLLSPNTSRMGLSQRPNSSQHHIEVQAGTPSRSQNSPKRTLPEDIDDITTNDQESHSNIPSQSNLKKGRYPQRLTQWALSGLVTRSGLSSLQKYLIHLMDADYSERKRVR